MAPVNAIVILDICYYSMRSLSLPANPTRHQKFPYFIFGFDCNLVSKQITYIVDSEWKL